MAVAYAVVKLFDTTTWADVEYRPFANPVHKNIAPHVLHQHQYNTYVQMEALIASNTVRKDRHSNQTTTLLYSMQYFNRKTALKVNEICKEKTGLQK